MAVEWRECADFPGYSVSSDGLVRNDDTSRILRQYDSDGYRVVKPMDRFRNRGITTRVHRLVAKAFCPNPLSKPHVDHADRQITNNHATNLRWCTAQENARNRKKQANNKSGRTGVYWNTGAKKWMAYVRIGGKMEYLGVYDDLEEASFMRDIIAAEAYGDFFPREVNFTVAFD